MNRKLVEQYRDINRLNGTKWKLGNKVLYDLCKKYPYHKAADEIVAKIWLIGRSYSAAIERRKNKNKYNGDDFYYDVVAPAIIDIGNELDKRLSYLNKCKGNIEDNFDYIMETHKLLIDALHKITDLDKRSLVSKYLHFHCPDMFFIYDSITENNLKHINNDRISGKELNYDHTYYKFCKKLLTIQNCLKQAGEIATPRNIDTFVLNYSKYIK